MDQASIQPPLGCKVVMVVEVASLPLPPLVGVVVLAMEVEPGLDLVVHEGVIATGEGMAPGAEEPGQAGGGEDGLGGTGEAVLRGRPWGQTLDVSNSSSSSHHHSSSHQLSSSHHHSSSHNSHNPSSINKTSSSKMVMNTPKRKVAAHG